MSCEPHFKHPSKKISWQKQPDPHFFWDNSSTVLNRIFDLLGFDHCYDGSNKKIMLHLSKLHELDVAVHV